MSLFRQLGPLIREEENDCSYDLLTGLKSVFKYNGNLNNSKTGGDSYDYDGKNISSLSYNGTTDQFITMSGGSGNNMYGRYISRNTTAFSFNYWTKATTSQQFTIPYTGVFQDGSHNTHNNNTIYQHTYNGSSLTIDFTRGFNNSGSYGSTYSGFNPGNDVWFMITIVIDGSIGNYSYYINGELINTVSHPTFTFNGTSQQYFYMSNTYRIVLNNMLMYDKALTQCDIKTLYNNGLGLEWNDSTQDFEY